MNNRRAFTLIELMLALSLIVVATALIGSLMQMYARNFATRGEDIRRMQLARSILNMIAEDLRSVVTVQKYDASVMQKQLGASGGGGGGGAGSGPGGGASAGQNAGGAGATAGAGGASGSAGAASNPSTAGSATTGASTGASSGATTESAGTAPLARAPGLYGTQYSLSLDVSRLARVDEYIPQSGAMISPTLVDVPGDIKTVDYFVQSPSIMGVEDSLSSFNDTATLAPTLAPTGGSSGLVRRALDRAIVAYAEEIGDTARLMRTGDLIAPEVVSLEFSFYDGVQWTYQWDSSSDGLPWLIQITLGMQSATGEAKAELDSGISLGSLSFEQQKEYGIEVYELVVAIPGAQLHAADAAAAEADAGMSSMGF